MYEEEIVDVTYEGKDYICIRCNGGGCSVCDNVEEEE